MNAPRVYGLAVDKVVFEGEPVAAVAAVDRYLAEDALEAIEVEYEVLEPVMMSTSAPGLVPRRPAPPIYEGWPDNVQLAGTSPTATRPRVRRGRPRRPRRGSGCTATARSRSSRAPSADFDPGDAHPDGAALDAGPASDEGAVRARSSACRRLDPCGLRGRRRRRLREQGPGRRRRHPRRCSRSSPAGR